VLIVSAPRALIEGAVRGPSVVVVEGGRIMDVLDRRPPPGPEHVALQSGLLTAGMVDLQINGAFGIDAVEADQAGWERLATGLPSTGVTAFQPTFITAPLPDHVAGLHRAGAARSALEASGRGARILGVHLEGPFLSPRRSGMHPVQFLATPTRESVDRLIAEDVVRGLVLTCTVAPELPGALAAIRALTGAGIRVWIGHSDATADVVTAAVEAGASGVTHLFNAQSGIGHREPGVAGTALADDRLTLGLIADLHHVAAAVCRIVFRAAAGRVVLVTDAMAAMGMPPGRYHLGGVEVIVEKDGEAPRRSSGVLAGSALRLDQAVRNLVGIGVDLPTVLDAATRVPAEAIGRPDLGRIVPGAAADLVWWSDDLQIRRTWVRGEPAFAAPDLAASPVG
jgi:N-acetylglucosamine-6-phosphate deacetylase